MKHKAEDELNMKLSGALCVVGSFSAAGLIFNLKCLLELKPNSVSWDWEPGTAVFDALF
jgi:hypothetical protein